MVRNRWSILLSSFRLPGVLTWICIHDFSCLVQVMFMDMFPCYVLCGEYSILVFDKLCWLWMSYNLNFIWMQIARPVKQWFSPFCVWNKCAVMMCQLMCWLNVKYNVLFGVWIRHLSWIQLQFNKVHCTYKCTLWRHPSLLWIHPGWT